MTRTEVIFDDECTKILCHSIRNYNAYAKLIKKEEKITIWIEDSSKKSIIVPEKDVSHLWQDTLINLRHIYAIHLALEEINQLG
ncbi:hypothetical protein [Pectobacterium sp. LFLA-215]|uniref:hypothetical protein n=1 Tax=Pectobacterium sp. LFLA-215 TaxID=3419008 RepID=UPI003F5BC8AE